MGSVVNDFRNGCGRWVKSGRINGEKWYTLSYMKWKGMRSRCQVGGSVQKNHPTYIGCEMSDTFSDFQLFTDWHVQQVGYGLDKYELEKDILFSGNKEYNDETCVLVPPSLNTFFVANDATRGEWPQGVYWKKIKCKYVAALRIAGRTKHIGYYTTAEAASAAYKKAKEAEAYRWYERLRDGEFIVDERVIERMRTWTLEPEIG